MNTRLQILLCLAILSATMACAFVQNMIFPPSPATGTPAQPPTREPVPPGNIQPINCTDDNCLRACLDRLEEVLQTRPFDSIGNSIYEEQGANFNLVVYQVAGDEIVAPAVLYVPAEYRKYQEDTASHLRIWGFYVAMIPAELRSKVDQFVIYTDGFGGDSVAWVEPSPTDADAWRVGVDLLDSDYPAYLADSLVHETAHLLTLNTDQLPVEGDGYYFYDVKQDNFMECQQLAVEGACSLPGSYLNLFYQEFWKESYHEWWEIEQEALNASSDDEYYQILRQFYDRHEDWFINDYAATNIKEDMAESFAFFVLNPRPSGSSIFEQKAAFYYEFPELVEYRRQMIEGLCSYIQ
jgi:hypothetical protein